MNGTVVLLSLSFWNRTSYIFSAQLGFTQGKQGYAYCIFTKLTTGSNSAYIHACWNNPLCLWSPRMGFWQPATNLKDYVSHNPPAVTFFLCLLSLAISFVCFSSYISTHTLPNPDTVKDWNHLLSSLSQLKLCANASSSDLVSPVPSLLMDRDASTNSTNSPSVTSLHLRVPVSVITNSDSGSVEDFRLQTTLRAKELRIGGNEIVNVILEVLSGNDTYTCLSISAPADILPKHLLPPECPASQKNISTVHVEASKQPPPVSQTCYSLQHKNDPTLTVMLTQGERNVAVRHLLEVSASLLGVCLMLCLVASATHSLMRRHLWNGLDLQNEPLIDS